MIKNYFILNLINSNSKSAFIMLFILLFLSSCSTSKSIKQINLIDKNITNIQSEVKEVKNTIKKTKQTIDKIKQEQPKCNIDIIETQIDLLEIQTNGIDNSLSYLKQDLGNTKYIVDIEVKEYRSKYLKYKTFTYILILLLLIIFVNYIKGNFAMNFIK